jgi:hypothetical protein
MIRNKLEKTLSVRIEAENCVSSLNKTKIDVDIENFIKNYKNSFEKINKIFKD